MSHAEPSDYSPKTFTTAHTCFSVKKRRNTELPLLFAGELCLRGQILLAAAGLSCPFGANGGEFYLGPWQALTKILLFCVVLWAVPSYHPR